MSNQISIGTSVDQLQRGQSMKIPIVLQLESRIKVRGIHVRFHGAEETKANYTTTHSDGKGHVTTTTHTAVEQVTITEQKQLLAGRERAGFLANLGDALATLFGGGRHVVMSPGEYEYSVDISIPTDAPPTHKGKRSRVFYELSARVDVPLGRDVHEVHSFSVAPFRMDLPGNPVRVRYPDDEGRGFWDKVLGPDVRIDLALARDALRQGESVDGVFQVDTDKPIEVRAIRARLVGHETSKAHGHHDGHNHKGEAVELARPGMIQGSYSKEFSLTADTVGEMPVTAKGKLFAIDWFVQVELDVPWAKDPKIRVPIVLLPKE